MTTRASGLALLVVLLLAGVALGQRATQGDLPPEAILRSILIASRVIDFEGTKVLSTRRGERMETVTVLEAHKRPNKTRLEYLSPDAIAGRVIVDNGLEAWHYEPRLHATFQGPTLTPPAPLPGALRSLIAGYRLQPLGSEDLIGRSTFVLALSVDSPGRPGPGGQAAGQVRRIFWVDQATGLPLRIEERHAGEVVYESYFTRISFSLNLPEALFRLRAPAGARIFSLFASEGTMPVPQVQREVGFVIRRAAGLPPGLVFQGAAVTRYGSVTAAHLRYLGGGSPISVFEVPRRRVRAPDLGIRVRQDGTVYQLVELGYFNLVTWEEGTLRITIVGAQPVPVLLDLAARFGGR